MTNFEDLSGQLEDHCDDVRVIMLALLPFHKAREATYNLSFAKRGETGVWMNLMRKTDRLDRLASKVMSTKDGSPADGVTLVDTLVDTAMYALKWLAVIKRIRPEDMEAWVADVYCRDTGMESGEALAKYFDEILTDKKDMWGKVMPIDWQTVHHPYCGKEYRDCHPTLCPKEHFENTGSWRPELLQQESADEG